MAEHKHAEVLRAIADGVPPGEFEVMFATGSAAWSTLKSADIVNNADFWEVRRKPQYIIVNGFKVPKPLEKGCKVFTVFVPRFVGDLEVDVYGTDKRVNQAIELGVAHDTEAAAIAHRRAMLGIDPEAA